MNNLYRSHKPVPFFVCVILKTCQLKLITFKVPVYSNYYQFQYSKNIALHSSHFIFLFLFMQEILNHW